MQKSRSFTQNKDESDDQKINVQAKKKGRKINRPKIELSSDDGHQHRSNGRNRFRNRKSD